MLKLILLITLGVPDVASMEKAYNQWLGYVTVERGTISQELATAWNASGMIGRPYVLVQPESKEQIYLRFVQVESAPGYVPMKTYGWNAIEMLVQDPYALHERFQASNSPFKIAGLPRPLGPNSTTVAMQIIGPAGEVVYLTKPGGGLRPVASTAVAQAPRQVARTPVDRPFVIILGGIDINDMRSFYSENFGLSTGRVNQARMTVLNRAYGLDIETTHPISGARVSPQYSIEIDGYPVGSTARPTRAGELPPAIATVAFEIDSLENLTVPLLAPSRAVAVFPYSGRRVGLTRGAAGELIELVETRN